MKFKIGDKVRVSAAAPVPSRLTGVATVLAFYGSLAVGVEFSSGAPYGHNLDGKCTSYRGWWVDPKYLTLVREVPCSAQ